MRTIDIGIHVVPVVYEQVALLETCLYVFQHLGGHHARSSSLKLYQKGTEMCSALLEHTPVIPGISGRECGFFVDIC